MRLIYIGEEQDSMLVHAAKAAGVINEVNDVVKREFKELCFFDFHDKCFFLNKKVVIFQRKTS